MYGMGIDCSHSTFAMVHTIPAGRIVSICTWQESTKSFSRMTVMLRGIVPTSSISTCIVTNSMCIELSMWKDFE